MLGRGIGKGAWSGLRAPTIQPPVDIAAARGYAQYPIVPLARPSAATYVTAEGLIATAAANEHRYDWTTGQRALLIEPPATNICIRSESFENWASLNASAVVNVAAAPSGDMTADQIVENTVNNQHRLTRSGVTISSGKIYVASIYAKSANRGLRLTFFDGAGAWNAAAVFDLQTGTVGVPSGTTVVSATITPCPDGWYRLELRAKAVASASAAQLLLGLTNGGNVSYAGDGASGAYVWGAQIEAPETLVADQSDMTVWPNDIVVVTGDALAAPDGTMTADLITETADNGQHRIKRLALTVTPQPYRAFIHAKSNGRDLRITLFDGSGAWNASAIFNLTTGTVSAATGATAISATITAQPNGWYLCELAANCVLPSTNAQVLFTLASAGEVVYAGDGISGTYVWGAGLHRTARPTSYIKTDASPVARSADLPSVDLAPGTYDVEIVTDAGATTLLDVEHAGGAYWPLEAVGAVYSIRALEAGGAA